MEIIRFCDLFFIVFEITFYMVVGSVFFEIMHETLWNLMKIIPEYGSFAKIPIGKKIKIYAEILVRMLFVIALLGVVYAVFNYAPVLLAGE